MAMGNQQFDLVVAGCGVAGLAAAVSGAQAGLKVAVIERSTREERGGQSRYTEAYLRMKTLSDTTDDFETHLAENGSGAIDPDLVEESAHSQRGALRMRRFLDQVGIDGTRAVLRQVGFEVVRGVR
ncbi:MAG: FAD-binding protein, partial [Comamonadaceae bacterium]